MAEIQNSDNFLDPYLDQHVVLYMMAPINRTHYPNSRSKANPESEFMEFSATETHDPRRLPPAKTKNKNKQRFSDEQIRLLESTFESGTKLEARKKEAVAGELGLHPRQIAIWFQNRRARGKSKQMEQDLMILKANYDGLASQFEVLKEEKKALLAQLQKLNDMADNNHPSGSSTNEERHSLQEELEKAAMDHPCDVQKSGITKWIEEEEGGQLWGTQQHLNSSMTSPSLHNSCYSPEWGLHFCT